MAYIKAKFLGWKKPRSEIVQMGGFQGPAITAISEGPYACAEGAITHRYRLPIQPDGHCEIYDNEFNREKLRSGLKLLKREILVPKYINKEWRRVPQTITEGPFWEILDGTDINKKSKETIEVSANVKAEMEALRKQVDKLEYEKKELESRQIKADNSITSPIEMGEPLMDKLELEHEPPPDLSILKPKKRKYTKRAKLPA